MTFPPVASKTALVTGCSTGIGLAAARMLRDRGWTAVPTARKEADIDRLRGEGFDPVRLDVVDGDSVRAAAEETLRRFGGMIGAVVNNAGFGQPGALEDLSRDALRYQFEVNVFGLQDLTNRLIPVFRKQGYGRIVNVSSVVGRISLPFMGAYSATKFAVEAMSDALRVELHGSGIAVSLVEPGPIATAFGANAVEVGRRNLADVPSHFQAQYRKQLDIETRSAGVEDAFRKPPESVAAKIVHALESPHPKTRYKVTLPAWFGAFMARFAPDRLLDHVMISRLKAQIEKGKPSASNPRNPES